MARFLGARCHCGQVAVSHRKIRSYRAAGRLTEREVGLLLPRADKPPVEPLRVHHLLKFLEERLGKGIKTRFWDGRLSWPRNSRANAAAARVEAQRPAAPQVRQVVCRLRQIADGSVYLRQ
jgi:hypothetical protein